MAELGSSHIYGTLTIDELLTANGKIGVETTPDYYVDINSGDSIGIRIGPNATYSENLMLGGWGSGTDHCWIRTSNGNFHLDSKDGHNTYINHYTSGDLHFCNGGGDGKFYNNLMVGNSGTPATTLNVKSAEVIPVIIESTSTKCYMVLAGTASDDSGIIFSEGDPGDGTSNRKMMMGWDADQNELRFYDYVNGGNEATLDLSGNFTLNNGDLNVSTGNISATGTITGSKVYNAVWNDYAEGFEYNKKEKTIIPGLCYKQTKDGLVLTEKRCERETVGVFTDTAAMIVGAEDCIDFGNGNESENKNKSKLPISLAGKVKAYVKGKIKIGQELVSDKNGYVTKASLLDRVFRSNRIVGRALEDKDENLKRIWVLV